MNKWMVWDTASGDKVFHDTEEKALQDYSEAITMIQDGELAGTVYLFELKEQKDIEIPVD